MPLVSVHVGMKGDEAMKLLAQNMIDITGGERRISYSAS
jgi:hypothetical protein